MTRIDIALIAVMGLLFAIGFGIGFATAIWAMIDFWIAA